jgi:hypothetical protein
MKDELAAILSFLPIIGNGSCKNRSDAISRPGWQRKRLACLPAQFRNKIQVGRKKRAASPENQGVFVIFTGRSVGPFGVCDAHRLGLQSRKSYRTRILRVQGRVS